MRRRRTARNDESKGAHDFYDKVYDAERPELFFKAAPGRVRGPGGTIGVREDSGWDVPEPELALVIGADAKILGYTIGNDVSSRSIEGENPLYLPQAKVYKGSLRARPVHRAGRRGADRRRAGDHAHDLPRRRGRLHRLHLDRVLEARPARNSCPGCSVRRTSRWARCC